MENWQAAASCLRVDPDLFYPSSHDGEDNQGLEAKRVCADCPSRIACLDYAVRANEEFGIWGGTGRDRRIALRRVWATGNALAYHQAIAAETNELARTMLGLEDERDEQPARPCNRCGHLVAPGRHPVDRNSPDATCGIPSTYNKGCRCVRCITAKSVYSKRKRLVKALKAGAPNDYRTTWTITLIARIPLVPLGIR